MPTTRDATYWDSIVDFSIPEGWRRVDLPNLMGFAPARDLDAVQGDIEAAPLTFMIQTLEPKAGQSFESAIEELMGRRVRQGYPERFLGEVAGLPARGFGWTDGVCDILSFFVRGPGGQFVELIVCRSAFPREERAPLGDVARELLARVRWRGADGGFSDP